MLSCDSRDPTLIGAVKDTSAIPSMEGAPTHIQTYSHHLLLSSLLLPALLVCILVPTVLVRRRRRRRLHLPPGPRALPVLGHFHLLGANPHKSLFHLSKRHGPLMLLRFGSVPVLVASSPAAARLLLQTHDQTFACRPQPSVAMQLFACKDIVFSQPGPYWKMLRRICTTDLFGAKRLESFRPMIAEEVHGLLCSIAESPDKVPLRATLYAVTSNIISRMAIGKRVQEMAALSQADPSHSLVALVLEAIHLGCFNVGDFIPWLAWMDLQGYARKSTVVAQKLRTVWQEVIDVRRSSTHQRNVSASEQVDFLDVLLSAAESEDVQITDANIMAVLTDMFSGGIDTSTISVEWALAELIAHPLIMKKAQDELEEVVGASRLVQQSDIPNLPYLKAVVKETMRLHPVLPLLVPHMANQQCQVSEFDIPANTQAYVNVWAIGRDPIVWERPLEFWPERFLESTMDVRGQHFELLPFGSGRRSCPGMILGLDSVHLMLASLLQAFDWSKENMPNMEEKFGILMTLADPLVAKASLKVPKHLLKV